MKHSAIGTWRFLSKATGALKILAAAAMIGVAVQSAEAVDPKPTGQILVYPSLCVKSGHPLDPVATSGDPVSESAIRDAYAKYTENFYKEVSHMAIDTNGNVTQGDYIRTKTFGYIHLPWSISAPVGSADWPTNDLEAWQQVAPGSWVPFLPDGQTANAMVEGREEPPVPPPGEPLQRFMANIAETILTGTNELTGLADEAVWTPGEAFNDLNEDGNWNAAVLDEDRWWANNKRAMPTNWPGFPDVLGYHSQLNGNPPPWDSKRGEIYADYSENTVTDPSQSNNVASVGFDQAVTIYYYVVGEQSNRTVTVSEFDLSPFNGIASREGDFHHTYLAGNPGTSLDVATNNMFDYNFHPTTARPLVYRAYRVDNTNQALYIQYQQWELSGAPYGGINAAADGALPITKRVRLYQAAEIFGDVYLTTPSANLYTDTVPGPPDWNGVTQGYWDSGVVAEPFEDFISWWDPYGGDDGRGGFTYVADLTANALVVLGADSGQILTYSPTGSSPCTEGRGDRDTPISYADYVAYITWNYPGDTNGLIARAGNGSYDGPDNWTECSNNKYRQSGDLDSELFIADEPDFWDPATNYPGGWTNWYVQTFGGPISWPGTIPDTAEENPSNDFAYVRNSATNYSTYPPTEVITTESGWMPPEGQGWSYDSAREFADLPSSLYHSGGDGRFGEITSPFGSQIYGEDLGENDPTAFNPFDFQYRASGPLCYNIHGLNGYDAGNQLTLESLTRKVGGDAWSTNHPFALRDSNLDGMIDQGETKLGYSTYTIDYNVRTRNDGQHVGALHAEYPHNRQRYIEDCIEATDAIQDYRSWTNLYWYYYFAALHYPGGGGFRAISSGKPAAPEGFYTRDGWAVGNIQVVSQGSSGEGSPDTGVASNRIDGFVNPGYGQGVINHEMGHDWWGLDDFYDYDALNGIIVNSPIGGYDLMATGGQVYGIPETMIGRGWSSAQELTNTLVKNGGPVTVEIYPAERGTNGYFRYQRQGSDHYEAFWFWYAAADTVYAPPGGRGVYIEHVESGNATEAPLMQRMGDHYNYQIIQADGLEELDEGLSAGDPGDPWPGSSERTVFTADTFPAARWWDQSDAGIRITNIKLPAPGSRDPARVTFDWYSPNLPLGSLRGGADSDNDGIPDVWEYHFFGNLGRAGATSDTDLDGLSDYGEYLSGTSPINNVNQASTDASDDPDGDGLSNVQEVALYGTNPLDPDTDDDGSIDGDEVRAATAPTYPLSSTNVAQRGLDLSATPAGIALPTAADLAGRFDFDSDGFTVEFWIRPEGDGNGTVFVENGKGGARLEIGLTNYVPFATLSVYSNIMVSVGGQSNVAPLVSNEWSHCAFVWMPEYNTFQLYRDGLLLIAQQTLFDLELAGGTAVMARDFTSGHLDNLRFWGYARTKEEVEGWFSRVVPASGYVDTSSYQYQSALVADYRFDDGGLSIEDFAHLNETEYRLTNGVVTSAQFVELLGTDDADGDGIPEWWLQLHGADRYPTAARADWNVHDVTNQTYKHVFTAYSSIGSRWVDRAGTDPVRWVHVEELPGLGDVQIGALDGSSGTRGKFVWFYRYVNLPRTPSSASMEVFTASPPSAKGTDSTVDRQIYINGGASISATTQDVYDVTSLLHQGRNLIAIRVEYTASPNWTTQDGVDLGEMAHSYFDARMEVDGVEYITRGQTRRLDPSSVWHGESWSQDMEDSSWAVPSPDLDGRYLETNPDYGVPTDTDQDGVNVYNEFLIGTNPGDSDSDGNGVPDAEEDFDGDGLQNGDEIIMGSDPRLTDTDDDGISDLDEVSAGSDPADGFSPFVARAASLGGSNDYVQLPLQSRFALKSWTLEAWVRPATNFDGGTVLRRVVRDFGVPAVNYAIQITSNHKAVVFFTSQSGATVAVTNPVQILADGETWTHLAATWNSTNAMLSLHVGDHVVQAVKTGRSPVTYAGGAIFTRVGESFEGLIDDVRIWGTAQSADDIVDNASKYLTGIEADLVAYYRFDDESSLMPKRAQDGLVGRLGDWQNNWMNAAVLVGGAAFADISGASVQTEDSDGDGMPDGWENLHGLDPDSEADALLDPDGDGLTNLAEYQAGTNPNRADSDGDGLNDGLEDSDGDGLGNADEVALGTDPGNVDTDDDGYSDFDEISNTEPSPVDSYGFYRTTTGPTESISPYVPRSLLMMGRSRDGDGVGRLEAYDSKRMGFLPPEEGDDDSDGAGPVVTIIAPAPGANFDERFVTISGTVTSAQPLSWVRIYENDEYVQDVDVSGTQASFSETIIIGSGANNLTVRARDIDGEPGEAIVSVNGLFAPAGIRVTQTWSQPGDLDTWLLDPLTRHMGWTGSGPGLPDNIAQRIPGSMLDIDNTQGLGPENITVERSSITNGNYEVWMNNFSNGGQPESTVRVLVNEGLENEQYMEFGPHPMPVSDGNGNNAAAWWHVTTVQMPVGSMSPVGTPVSSSEPGENADSGGNQGPGSSVFAQAGWTIECWVRPTNDVQSGAIASYLCSDLTPNIYVYQVGLLTNMPFIRVRTGGGMVYTATAAAIPRDTWTHLAFVFSEAEKSVRIHVDGEMVISQQMIEDMMRREGRFIVDGPFSMDGITTNAFTGCYVDELRVWDRDRGGGLISERMYQYVGPSATLIAGYRFDDGGRGIEDITQPDDRRYDLGTMRSIPPPDVVSDAKPGPDGWWGTADDIPAGPGADGHNDYVTAAVYAPLYLLPDADSDGLPDWFEDVFFAGDADAGDDPDGDGLSNLMEYYVQTNPKSKDSDADGVLDALEDFDLDGVANGREAQVGSDPRLIDTDDDGVSDLVELANGTRPDDPHSPLADRALSVDGNAASYVLLPHALRFGSSNWTVQAWIKPSNLQGGALVARTVEAGVTNYLLGIDGTGRPFVAYSANDGANQVTLRAPAFWALSTSKWTHVAGTFDARTHALCLYLNGEQMVSTNSPGIPTVNGRGPVDTRVGQGFSGMIDEVAIYEQALPRTVMADAMIDPATQGGLLTYYRFDDGTSATNGGGGAWRTTSARYGWDWGQVSDSSSTNARPWEAHWVLAGTLFGNAEMVAAPDAPVKSSEADDDGDGLPNGWEAQYGLDPENAAEDDGPNGDPDGDGLSNLSEYRAGTNPFLRDTDGDGVPDGSEDSDGDGLSNGEEVSLYGTHPGDPDTDDDGVSDGQEVNPLIVKQDGRVLTSPLDARSPLVLRSMILSGVPVTVPSEGADDEDGDRFVLTNGVWTLEAWVNLATTNESGALIQRLTSSGQTNFALRIDRNVPSVMFTTPAGYVVRAGGPVALPSNTWTHVAGVFSTSARSLELYVNGISYQAQVTLDRPSVVTANADMTIGAGLNGYIDEIRVWQVARTPDEIATWMGRIINSPPTIPDLVANYRFDDGENTAITNLVTGRADGHGAQDSKYPEDWCSDWPHAIDPVSFSSNEYASLLGMDDLDVNNVPDWWESLFFGYTPGASSSSGGAGGPTALALALEDLPMTTPGTNSPADWREITMPVTTADEDVLESDGDYAFLIRDFYVDRPADQIPAAWGDVVIRRVYYSFRESLSGVYVDSPYGQDSMPYDGVWVNGTSMYPDDGGAIYATSRGSSDINDYWRYYSGYLWYGTGDDGSTYYETIKPGHNRIAIPLRRYTSTASSFSAQLTITGMEVYSPSVGTRLIQMNDPVIPAGAKWFLYGAPGQATVPPMQANGNEWWHRYYGMSDAQQATAEAYGSATTNAGSSSSTTSNVVVGADLIKDSDGDGLNNLYEYLSDANPNDSDTDNDGVLDSLEDADRDGLSNAEEQRLGSHPGLVDSDDDGVRDDVEVDQGSEPSDSLSRLVDRVLTLNDGNARVDMPDERRFALTNWTVEAWINPSGMTTGLVVSRAVSDNKWNYSLGLDASLRPILGFTASTFAGSTSVTVAAAGTLPSDEWSHVAGTFDAVSGRLTVYVNGEQAGLRITSQRPARNGLGPFLTSAGGRGFVGQMDEVMIYSRPLSALEIQADMRGKGPVGTNEAALVAYYRFDDGTSATNSGAGGWVGTSGNPDWTRGQVEDFCGVFELDWLSNWTHGGTLVGDALMTPALPGAPVELSKRDSDGDRMPDGWEVQYGLNALVATLDDGADGDPDGDGLGNLYEYFAGTDPRNGYTSGTSTNDWNLDSDGDGVVNGDEQDRYRTHPGLTDTDDDGILDGVEVTSGFDPCNSMNPYIEKALHFAGGGGQSNTVVVSDMIDGEYTHRLDLPVWTVECFVRPEALPVGDCALVSRVTADAGRINYQVGLTNGVPYVCFDGATNGARICVVGLYPVETNQWTHLAGRLGDYDDDGINELTLFVNGARVDRTIVGDQASMGAGDLVLGSGGFVGDLKEIRVWMVPRSDAEINEARNRTLLFGGGSIGSGYLEVPGSGHLKEMSEDGDDNLYEDWTLETWVKTTGSGMLVARRVGTDPNVNVFNYYLMIDSAGRLRAGFAATYYIYPYSSAYYDSYYGYYGYYGYYRPSWYYNYSWTYRDYDANDIHGEMTVNDGQWHHVAFVRDSTRTRLYVDGILDSAQSRWMPLSGYDSYTNGTESAFNDPNWWTGTSTNSWQARAVVQAEDGPLEVGKGLIGEIDEVRVWNRALSTTELRAGRPVNVAGTEDGLVSYFSFDYPVLELPLIDDRASVEDVEPKFGILIGAAQRREGYGAPITIDPLKTLGRVALAGYYPADDGGVTLEDMINRMGIRPFDGVKYAGVLHTNVSFTTNNVLASLPFDSDDDGLPDEWEVRWGLDPANQTGDNGADGDPDQDGLSNYQEYLAGTDPRRFDTDSDGRGDYDSTNTMPYATWGYLYDDGDQMDNAWEMRYPTACQPALYDAHHDPDGDGWCNYNEFLGDTDPSSPTSYPVPPVRLRVRYEGLRRTGRLMVVAYTGEARNGNPTVVFNAGALPATALPGEVYTVTVGATNALWGHLTEGTNWFSVFVDNNGNGVPDAGEPADHPYEGLNMEWGGVDLNIGLTDYLPGYGRFSWSANAAGTYAISITRVNTTGQPIMLQRTVEGRTFFQEGDYRFMNPPQFGLPAASLLQPVYEWFVDGVHGGYFTNAWAATVAVPVPVSPIGSDIIMARNELVWKTDVTNTQYEVRIITGTNGPLFWRKTIPSPYRDYTGKVRYELPFYAGDDVFTGGALSGTFSNGVYSWSVRAIRPSMTGNYFTAYASFRLNVQDEVAGAYCIAGRVSYYGRAPTNRIVVQAFTSEGFSGTPAAQVTLSALGNYKLRGLPAGLYSVRAFIDQNTNGVMDSFESFGVVKSTSSEFVQQYKPARIGLPASATGKNLTLRDRDTDNDNNPDAYEVFVSGSITNNGAGEVFSSPPYTDTDGDGVNDLKEYQLGSDPRSTDTDGDGVPDGQEYFIEGTSLVSADSDGDGIHDGVELASGMNPLDPDDDGDGVPTAVERAWGALSGHGAGVVMDAMKKDSDGDGISDLMEIAAGSDPLDAQDSNVVTIHEISVDGMGRPVVKWNTHANPASLKVRFILETSQDFKTWTTVGELVSSGMVDAEVNLTGGVGVNRVGLYRLRMKLD